jgi:hypothetical protein
MLPRLLLLGSFLLAAPSTTLAAGSTTGKWILEWKPSKEKVQMTFMWKRPEGTSHWGGHGMAIEKLQGLTAEQITGKATDVHFEIVRDAGTFVCDGRAGAGEGGGLFELQLAPGFAAELERRGVGKPTEAQQIRLALADAGLNLLDELAAQKYTMPKVDELVRMADHGVSHEYVAGMGRLGYRTNTVAGLVKLRDHGVDPGYILGLKEAGFDDLSTAELLTARDHGVDPEYVAEMRRLGHKDMTLQELVRVRDHGVDAQFIRGMAAHGHDDLPLAQLVRSRDHGVDPSYIKKMADAGYAGLELEELIRARDHGVDGAFARRIKSRLGRKVSLDELIRIRDRGGLD